MESPIPEPEPSDVRQVSAPGEDGEPLLCLLARRTYSFRGGVCRATGEPSLLVEEPLFDDSGLELLVEADLFPRKPFTDVVVRGHAYGYGAATSRAGIAIDGKGHFVDAIGDRDVSLSAGGAVRFGDPAPFDAIPLTWARAYGGRDRLSEERVGFPGEGLFGGAIPEGAATLDDSSPFAFPRNPVGTGYILFTDAEALDGLRLPNLELPGDRLTPERLAAGSPELWTRQPRPAGFGWVNYDWFPRDAFFGIHAGHAEDARFAEVDEDGLDPSLLDMTVMSGEKAARFTCGAPLGLQFAPLRGGETVELRGLLPEAPEASFRLPKAPRMKVDGRKGKLKDAAPRLQTVIVEPDEFRLTVVWSGAAPALRQYSPVELPEMPYELRWQD